MHCAKLTCVEYLSDSDANSTATALRPPLIFGHVSLSPMAHVDSGWLSLLRVLNSLAKSSISLALAGKVSNRVD